MRYYSLVCEKQKLLQNYTGVVNCVLQSSLEEYEPKQVAEMRTRGKIKSGVYRTYCAAGGNCCLALLMLSIFVLAQLVTSLGDYWMSFWYVCSW
jgi:ATP-binding cassette subfamily C (CFTR/MRP) protein 4